MNDSTTASTQNAGHTALLLTSVAELLADHPDLPAPVVFTYSTGHIDVTWQLMNNDATKDDQRAAAQQIVRTLGGKWDKEPSGTYFNFKRKHDDSRINLEVMAMRDQVCERVVVGTEPIVLPAIEAQAAQPERIELRDIVMWRCAPLLASDEAVA